MVNGESLYIMFRVCTWLTLGSLLGELTDVGRQVSVANLVFPVLVLISYQSTYNYGVALRKLYVDRLVSSFPNRLRPD